MEIICPIENSGYDTITLAHGGGGKLTQQLIDNIFKQQFKNEFLNQSHDAARLPITNKPLAMTTDSYVIQPVFFKGGDIGKLAVCGTVNDLLMAGACPKYLSISFILEEGFKISDLKIICKSIANQAQTDKVFIVTGDTKVIERTAKEPNIYINTTGIGEIESNINIHASNIQVGDSIIVSGDVGRHGIAIMAEREGLEFESDIISDCMSLNQIITDLLGEFGGGIHCMRDLTRGGLATSCIELATESNHCFNLYEDNIPVNQTVNSACEILGLSPYFSANEGRFVLIADSKYADNIVSFLSNYTGAERACIIGNVTKKSKISEVLLETAFGTHYRLVKQSGEQLPRIC